MPYPSIGRADPGSCGLDGFHPPFEGFPARGALLEAAESGFPTWVMPILQNIRHTVVIAGSVVVLVLAALV